MKIVSTVIDCDSRVEKIEFTKSEKKRRIQLPKRIK